MQSASVIGQLHVDASIGYRSALALVCIFAALKILYKVGRLEGLSKSFPALLR